MGNQTINTILLNFNRVVINPLLLLIFTVGLLLFVYGVVEFLFNFNASSGHSIGSLKSGKNHMLWGIVGMVVMATAIGIISLLSSVICSGGPSSCIV